jgi:hypothetical protein
MIAFSLYFVPEFAATGARIPRTTFSREQPMGQIQSSASRQELWAVNEPHRWVFGTVD